VGAYLPNLRAPGVVERRLEPWVHAMAYVSAERQASLSFTLVPNRSRPPA
jgi:hypothetical protein